MQCAQIGCKCIFALHHHHHQQLQRITDNAISIQNMCQITLKASKTKSTQHALRNGNVNLLCVPCAPYWFLYHFCLFILRFCESCLPKQRGRRAIASMHRPKISQFQNTLKIHFATTFDCCINDQRLLLILFQKFTNCHQNNKNVDFCSSWICMHFKLIQKCHFAVDRGNIREKRLF